jgi:hypothetical protein
VGVGVGVGMGMLGVARLLVGEEQLGGRDLGPQGAVLARRLYRERRRGRGGVRGAVHFDCSSCQSLHLCTERQAVGGGAT